MYEDDGLCKIVAVSMDAERKSQVFEEYHFNRNGAFEGIALLEGKSIDYEDKPLKKLDTNLPAEVFYDFIIDDKNPEQYKDAVQAVISQALANTNLRSDEINITPSLIKTG